MKKFAEDWIRTADLWRQKRPLYQLSHNHSPTEEIVRLVQRRVIITLAPLCSFFNLEKFGILEPLKVLRRVEMEMERVRVWEREPLSSKQDKMTAKREHPFQ